MRSIDLQYGKYSRQLNLPAQAEVLQCREPRKEIDKDNFSKGLGKLLGNPLVEGEVAVVVADKTRLCGYPEILPWIIETFNRLGIKDRQLVFHIAYGTHQRQSDEECLRCYGETYRKYRFIHHDCEAPGMFVSLGETSRGTRVRIRRDVLESALILTAGAVSHHYFAGYGGGRKLLFPGVAEKTSIYANHGLFLDRDKQRLAPGCWPGNLKGNPIAEDLKEIHDLLPPYCSIHALLNSRGFPARYTFGKTYQDFLAACAQVDSCYTISTTGQYRLVVCSAGGYPKDINMLQAHKTIYNAANLVQGGGTLVVFAECREGVGSATFLPYFQMGGRQEAFRQLAKNYTGNGGTALAMMEKTGRIRVLLVTALEDDVCRLIGTQRITLDSARRLVAEASNSVAVIPCGSLLVTERMGRPSSPT
jgi:nickel-dependent lactate racemase